MIKRNETALITNTEVDINQNTGELGFSLKKFPFLADHAFQGMVVLPGSAYIELALIIYNKLNNKLPFSISEINFENLILLSESETKITFEFFEKSNNGLRIKFSEKIESDSSLSKPSTTTSLLFNNDDEKSSEKFIEFDIAKFRKVARRNIYSGQKLYQQNRKSE